MKENQQEKLIQLATMARTGDQEAFEELCKVKGQSILYICIQTMGNLHDGEDAAQEVLIRMHKGISSLKEPKAFSSWLHRLIVNTCRDVGRKRMKDKYNASVEEMGDVFLDENEAFIPQEYLEVEEKKNKLLEIIDDLPKNYRLSIVLFYFEGLSYAEIAEAMDVDTKAVSNYLYRAKEAIRKEIEKDNDDDKVLAGFIPPMLPLRAILESDASVKAPTRVIDQLIQNTITPAAINGNGNTDENNANQGNNAKSSANSAKTFSTAGVGVAAVAAVSLVALFAWNLFNQPAGLPTDSESNTTESSSYMINSEEVNSEVQVSSAQPVVSSSAPAAQPPPPSQNEPEIVVYGSISGRVYYTVSGDSPATGEAQATGVKLVLVKANDVSQTVMSCMASDIDGTFMFENVPTGDYSIKVVLPEGARFLTGTSGSVIETASGEAFISKGDTTIFSIYSGHSEIIALDVPLNYAIDIEGTLTLPVTILGMGRRSGSSAAGVTVELHLVANGRVGTEVYRTVTDTTGYFVFKNIILTNNSTWELHFIKDGQLYYTTNEQAVLLHLVPGQSMNLEIVPILPVPDTAPPVVEEFKFLDGDCGVTCNHKNPRNISLVVSDASAYTVTFIITSQEGKEVTSGEWQAESIPEILAMVRNVGNGKYTIAITATDIHGNTVTKSLSMEMYTASTQ